MTRLFIIALGFSLLTQLASAQTGNDEFFENRIRPLLVEHCIECHGGKNAEAGLQLTSRESILKGGESGAAFNAAKPGESLILKAVNHQGGLAMPPEKKLPGLQVRHLNRWLQGGLFWPKEVLLEPPTPKKRVGPVTRGGPITHAEKSFWSFQPVSNVDPPTKNGHPIDSFIDERLKGKSLIATQKASRVELIRRATFDLTGLPPKPKEIELFLNDESPDAFNSLISGLLDKPAYGERWGRHWLDVVRYADTAGETGDYPAPLAYKYRNWVIRAFNQDKPYDDFVRQQLAGDMIAANEPGISDARYRELLTATGFIAISRRFGFDVENYHYLTIQDTIDTVGQSMLGLSLGCARCHDHKFDPVNMEDYYAWYGIFESTRYSFPGSEEKKKSYDSFPSVPPARAAKLKARHDASVKTLHDQAAALKKRLGSVNARLIENDENLLFQGFEGLAPGPLPQEPYKPLETVNVHPEAQSPFGNVFPRGKLGVTMPRNSANNAFGYQLNETHTAQKSPFLYYNIDFRNRNGDGTSGAYRFYVGFGPGTSGAMELASSANSFFAKHDTTFRKVGNIVQNKWYNVQVKLDLRKKTFSGKVTCEDKSSFSFSEVPFTSGWNGKIDKTFVDKYGPLGGDITERDLDNVFVGNFPLLDSEKRIRGQKEYLATRQWHRHVSASRLEFAEKDREQHAGFHVWRGDPLPVVGVNTANQTLKVPGVVQPGSVVVHPGPQNGTGIVWKSPIDGRVRVQGVVADAHNCGDSVLWHLDCLSSEGGFQKIKAGETKVGSSSPISIASLQVNKGDFVQLSIMPKANYGCDLTDIALTFREIQGTRQWDLKTDVVKDLLSGNPHSDQEGNQDTWYFTEVPVDRGQSKAWKLLVSEKYDQANLKTEKNEISIELTRLRAETERLEQSPPYELLYAAMEKPLVKDSQIHVRGDHKKPGKNVPRRNLEILGKEGVGKSDGSGRLKMAQWITRDSNPLFARVMVNRIWQQHFGRGIVGTENDFGVRGERPSHPELLDWLATYFKSNGYSVKAMHRLIMTSRAYQRSSQFVSGNFAVDPDSRYLWRFNRRRLSAEEIRDSILSASGMLEVGFGEKHPFPPESSWAFSQHAPFYGVYPTRKRSVYLMQQRLKRHPFLALFDGADANVSTARRLSTTVPTQALFLMNSPFIHTQSAAFGNRLIQGNSSEADRIGKAYLLTLGRKVTNGELVAAKAFLENYRMALKGEVQAEQREVMAWSALGRTLLTRNEFLFVD